MSFALWLTVQTREIEVVTAVRLVTIETKRTLIDTDSMAEAKG